MSCIPAFIFFYFFLNQPYDVANNLSGLDPSNLQFKTSLSSSTKKEERQQCWLLKPGSPAPRTKWEVGMLNAQRLPSSQSLDKCRGVRRLNPHSWGDRWRRAGHWEDWEGLFKQGPTFKKLWGGDPTARMLLSCINKQQQLLCRPPSNGDPCPLKFSLATAANNTQS